MMLEMGHEGCWMEEKKERERWIRMVMMVYHFCSVCPIGMFIVFIASNLIKLVGFKNQTYEFHIA